jgi:hypothetical protein
VTTINYNLNDLTFGDNTKSLPYSVWLQLESRGDNSSNFKENRIGLLAQEISMSTSKTVPAFPIPFSGSVTGESTTLALDLGMASKTISISGIIVDQHLHKSWTTGISTPITTTKERRFTAFEIAQLIHSYVDSSALQEDQSLNELIILMPSRVDSNWEYFDLGGLGTSENSPIDELPLVPFTYHNRPIDMKNTVTLGLKAFPEPISNAAEQKGITGFISSFSSTISGEAFPEISFTLEFTEALVVGG